MIDFRTEALEFMSMNGICPQDVVLQSVADAIEHGYLLGKIEMVQESNRLVSEAAEVLKQARLNNFIGK